MTGFGRDDPMSRAARDFREGAERNVPRDYDRIDRATYDRTYDELEEGRRRERAHRERQERYAQEQYEEQQAEIDWRMEQAARAEFDAMVAESQHAEYLASLDPGPDEELPF